ncbi:hypothetical protein GWI33_012116 [Rhynchophorus ferrugineus]|uniref:Uncharacterized protein n=1 Tax=Rhynchophorus ferrugineus TaxID=354439 RepID=A0A834M7V8_RHYFE|nr:hypothetical protein GWI33_012116 [Rhynchophorus ferrugineus]
MSADSHERIPHTKYDAQPFGIVVASRRRARSRATRFMLMNGLLRALLPIRLFGDLIEGLNGRPNGRLYKMQEMFYMDEWFPVQEWCAIVAAARTGTGFRLPNAAGMVLYI